MENASKALIMAGGVLIGILLISFAVYLFADFGSTSAEINKRNVEQKLVEFNSKFNVYETNENKWTIYDILTVAGYAKENNDYWKDVDGGTLNEEYKITVKKENREMQDLTENEKKDELRNVTEQLYKYKCDVTYHQNGRVKEVKFFR